MTAVDQTDVETEQGCLGAMLRHQDVVHLLHQHLEPADFALERHQAVAAAAYQLADQGQAVDLLGVRRRLTETGSLSRAGGIDYLADLASAFVPSALVEVHALALAARARRRRMRDGLRLALDAAADETTSLEDLEALIERAKAETARTVRSGPRSLREIMRERHAAAELRASEGAVIGVPTGLSWLDRRTGGMRPGQLWLLAARPSLGKSTLGMQISIHAAMRGQRVIFFSAEMSDDEVGDRAISSEARVSSDLVRDGSAMHGACGVEVGAAIARLAELPIEVDDTGGIRVSQIRSRCRYVQAKGPLALVVVDYLQLLTPDERRQSRVESTTEISGKLKSLAKELKVPVLALSQLSRESEKANRRPQLSDLRDSGSLEQDGDVILLMHREAPRGPVPPGSWQPVELIVAKHRNGQRGTILLEWDAPTYRFREGTG